MLRFSLASLLGLVLFAAVGSAALANANEVWRQTMVTATLTLLLIATLAASVRSGRSRSFFLGFAVCGWIYLLLVFVSAFSLRDDLLTDRVLTHLFATIHREDAASDDVLSVAFTSDPATLVTGNAQGTIRLWNASTGQRLNTPAKKTRFRDFADIGHSIWVVILGCLGGCVAIFLWNKVTK